MGCAMKKNPGVFYESQIAEHTKGLDRLKKQLALSSGFRVLLFLLLCAGIYSVFGNLKWVALLLVFGVIGFGLLVVRHQKLQYQRDLKKALIALNKTETRVLDRVFFHLPDGANYKNTFHEFSQDIDLFGRGSFYQYINRTALASGADFLAQILTENKIDQIPEKQDAIQELAQMPKWRQHFTAVASLVSTEVSASHVVQWLATYQPFAPSWIYKISLGFTIGSVSLIGAYFTEFVSGYALLGWFLLGLAISGRYLRKINTLSRHTAQIQSTFEQFHKLILEIEQQTFTSEILSARRAQLITSSKSASSTLKQFSKYLDALDQRNNMLVGVLANGFMLRDILISRRIERWIQAHKNEVEAWFQVIAFYDAYNSLGNYASNHPTHTIPVISEDENVLTVHQGGHPLLDPDTMVRNDFKINRREFFIVTGANMAGKSTFLRTVSLHILMANIGLPVCASSVMYNPIKLITSMRTTDSLTDDESYFFSELKRLKFIVEKIETDRYFIILDEILKGTNSTDKAIGSRKFIEKLVGGNSTGIIATHDLSLCEVAKTLPAVKNYFFDARIEDDELYFDYAFKPGICQNMNASFLLKKMNIVD
mgnify:CR=1 FL=1